MRVMIAHNRYRFAGGEERHVELLRTALPNAGIEVQSYEVDSAYIERSQLSKLAAGVALAYRPKAAGIPSVLREWKPDVVHFHNIWPLLTPSALRAAKCLGAAVILTAHNYRFACPAGTLLRNGVVHDDCIGGSSLACALRGARESRLEGLAYGFALAVHRRLRLLERWVDAFVCPSEFVADMLIRSGISEDKVHVIRNGVPRYNQHKLQTRHFALYAGRLSDEKGIKTLLSASQLAREVPLVIAGDGPLVEEVRAAPSHVEYVGFLERDRIVDALSKAAYTILPSEFYENCPYAVLDSLMAGTPVLASRIGGLGELVEDGVTGRLVEAGEPAALANAMIEMWKSQELATMGYRAKAKAETDYLLDGRLDELIGLYEIMLRPGRRSQR